MVVNTVYLQDLKDFVNEKKIYFSIENAGTLLTSGILSIDVDPIDVDVSDSDDYEGRLRYDADVSGGEVGTVITSLDRTLKAELKGKI